MSRGIIGSIREEYLTETGEDPGHQGAYGILDRMCEAFFQKYHGCGHEYAVADMPDIADYLMTCWTGTDRAELRAAIKEVKTGRGMWRVSGYQAGDDVV